MTRTTSISVPRNFSSPLTCSPNPSAASSSLSVEGDRVSEAGDPPPAILSVGKLQMHVQASQGRSFNEPSSDKKGLQYILALSI